MEGGLAFNVSEEVIRFKLNLHLEVLVGERKKTRSIKESQNFFVKAIRKRADTFGVGVAR